MRRLLISFAIAALAAGTLAAPVGAAGVTRMVDDDGRASPGNCSGSAAAFKKVQKAVDASGKNDRVLVCPGTYRGRVTIAGSKDGLTLQSVTHLGATIRSPKTSTGEHAIVTVAPGARDVTVAHFRVLHTVDVEQTAGEDDCGWRAGIQADGKDALIESNLVVATGDGTLSDCALFGGIAVGVDSVGDAVVRYNVVKDFAIMGIAVGGAGGRMVAFRNIVRYHHLDVADDNTAASRRAARRTAAAWPAGGGQSMGIAVVAGASGSIRENTVSSHASRGPLSGSNHLPYLDFGIVVTPSSVDSAVRGNRVYRTQFGINLITIDVAVAGGDGSVSATGNLVLGNYDGIGVETSGGTIRGNQAFGNETGIRAYSASSGNTFEDNEADGNLQLDCRDDSVGTEVGNVDNTWTDNIGDNADPDEICESFF